MGHILCENKNYNYTDFKNSIQISGVVGRLKTGKIDDGFFIH